MRRYVVIKSWRDAGPTVSPAWRMWVGDVEDRLVFETGDEAFDALPALRTHLEERGLTVIDMQTEVVCEHDLSGYDDPAAHVDMGECDQAYRVAKVRVPASSADHAYRQTCRAMGLEPDGKGSESVYPVNPYPAIYVGGGA